MIVRLLSMALVSTAWLTTVDREPSTRSSVVNRQSPITRRPNIVFIHADDLGYGDLSSYGQEHFRTPSLDRMAAEGIRFTDYYAGSTVCAPSRAALMTGQHTGHTRVRGNGDVPLAPEEVTIGEVLQRAGYRTAVIGKWGLGTVETTGRPGLQGFDHSFGYLHHRHAHRQYVDHLWRNGERVHFDERTAYAGDLFTQDALAFIRANRRRPFFLYLSYTVPHAELRVPQDAMAPFAARFPETPFSSPRIDANPWPGNYRQGGYRSQPTPKAAFAGMVTRMDRDVGRLLATLGELGLDERTLVLFTSDNGPHREGGADPEFFDSNGPLRGIKRDLYEGGIRVPMIARWPGVTPAGRTSDHAWAHWDQLPTLAALAGARAPEGGDGLSMAGLLRGDTAPTHDFLYWEFHERGFQQAVRMGKWKAVRSKPGAPLELYDLETDIGETTDIAAGHRDVVARIEAYLETARTPSERWNTEN